MPKSKRKKSSSRTSNPLTKLEILDRLIAIGKVGGGARSTMICSDLIDQEQLYDVQEKLQNLMEDVALDVPGGDLILVKEFPYVWKPVPAK